MTRFQRLASTVSLSAFLGLGVASAAYAAAPQADQAEGARPQHGHHGRGGLLGASLHLDSLTPTQRQQIEALVTQERATHENVRAARNQLMQAIANGLGAGAIDDKSVAPGVQAVEGAIQADEPSERATVERLHAILTPAQRTELASRVEARGERAREHHADAKDGGPRMGAGPWARGLGLSDAQRAQIAANMQGGRPTGDETLREEEHATHKRVLEAFKGDRFVMSELAPAKDPRLVADEASGMVRMAKAAAPVLTAEQRATAAAKLREMASRVK